jgi:hypothetical protein
MLTDGTAASKRQLDDTRQAVGLMLDFAERTGLTSSHPQRRYLWTDAFAVCNFLALERRLNDEHFGALALALVERVHSTLGQHRSDEPRCGWLSGLSGAEAEAHPTAGGLRIGKPLPERLPGQLSDSQLEWEQDGQYFHYLTKWMHALDQAANRLGKPQLNRWARELLQTAHHGFVHRARGSGEPSMFWKMSIDLSRPLVASMGHHDPLDGWLTGVQLQTSAHTLAKTTPGPALTDAVTDFARMAAHRDLSTTDPLGLGGLLTDAYRARQLLQRGGALEPALVNRLLSAVTPGLAGYLRLAELRAPAAHRLAFRELGLAIGFSALALLARDLRATPDAPGRDELVAAIEPLSGHVGLGAQIRAFWSEPEHQRPNSWTQHRDINDVMLATSLVPEGFLVLG